MPIIRTKLPERTEMPRPIKRAYEIFCTGQRRLLNFLTGNVFRRIEGHLKGEIKAAQRQAAAANEAAAQAHAASIETRNLMRKMHDAQQEAILAMYKSER